MFLYAEKLKFSCQGRQKDVASALIASNVDGSDVHFRALCFLSSCLFHLQPRRIPVLDHMLKERLVLMAKFQSSSCWLKCLFLFPSRYLVLRQEAHPFYINSNTATNFMGNVFIYYFFLSDRLAHKWLLNLCWLHNEVFISLTPCGASADSMGSLTATWLGTWQV